MAISHILGFPRIGPYRELKKAQEDYWAQKIDQETLLQAGQAICKNSWEIQRSKGLDFVTVGDFSFYDHVLDTALMLGVVPARFRHLNHQHAIDLAFHMARGYMPGSQDVKACALKKWFNTNYHYIVPEIEPTTTFQLADTQLFDQVMQAQALGYHVKPVLLGPLTFLSLAKVQGLKKLDCCQQIIEVYRQILTRLKALNVKWVQIDEPILCQDLTPEWQAAFKQVYAQITIPDLNLLLTTYFGDLGENIDLVSTLPVAGLHVDLTQQTLMHYSRFPTDKVLSCGIIHGRNVWRADLRRLYQELRQAQEKWQEKLWISTSCSLLHTPVDLTQETALPTELKAWLAFAVQKVEEVACLATALTGGLSHVNAAFEDSDNRAKTRQSSAHIHQAAVKDRVASLTESMFSRQHPFTERARKQKQKFKLPLLPTTTIGSFPQTQHIRHLRHEFKAGNIAQEIYDHAIELEIQTAISLQEEVDLDVLVHGEAERSDMVEYFAEYLTGFALTQNGWVQGYGSRCVKPPIIYGDVSRKRPMTVRWSLYAQSQTDKPMKGMLTGPVTFVCWSFVRDDQPIATTATQIALALRDEINDLEANGIEMIQMDEPAFREGLPLRHHDWQAYLDWAIKAFRLATCGVKDSTQIHTHMCYSEFNDVIESIAALDPDVITLESSRSPKELLKIFEQFAYPNDIGPGVYDVHSPRIPTIEEIVDSLKQTATVIPVEKLWVNPDCGLKTRDWEEVKVALSHMVAAAKILRGDQRE